MDDWLKVVIVLGAITGMIALICLVCVVWMNAASRNLALAMGALGGSLFLVVTQLYFELRSPPVTKDFITAEYMIDRAAPLITAPRYRTYGGAWRAIFEQQSGKLLGEKNPTAFAGNREKLNVDMTLYSLLLYLIWYQWDWQMTRTVYQGSGHIEEQLLGISKPNECTILSTALLRKKLNSAGNVFAEGGIGLPDGKQLCLPPGSALQVASKELIIRNRLVEIRFTAEPSGGISHVNPGAPLEAQFDLKQQSLPDGQPRYENRLIGIRVDVFYSRVRAQNPNIPKYQDWAKRIIDGAAEWFSVRNAPEAPQR